MTIINVSLAQLLFNTVNELNNIVFVKYGTFIAKEGMEFTYKGIAYQVCNKIA